MLPAVDGLEAGDARVIGEDGRLQRCTRARQTSLVGVYSTRPAVLGGVSAQAVQARAAGEDATKTVPFVGMNQVG